MYFFKNHGDSLSISYLGLLGGSLSMDNERRNSIFAALLGEERPVNMLSLLTILVVLLHIAGMIWLLQPVEQETPAKPLIMEVQMIAMSAPKPSAAPPTPAPPPPEKKPPPIKPQPKPVPKKMPPVVQKAPDFAPTEPVAQSQPVTQTTTASQSSAATESKASTPPQVEQFTEANFRANYAHNPKPEYPTIAKSRSWQGKVMLRVKVSAEGLSDAVEVEQSSGHDILDESAVEAVKKWRFIPAKRGETPVASSVIVPIIFSLRD